MEIIEDIVKVGERGQIVIPAKIRKKERIGANTYLRVIDIDGRIIIDKIRTRSIEKIIHSLTSLGLNDKDWEAIFKSRDIDR